MKSKELKVATDIKGNELKAGDRVAYVSCLYDPLIGTGTVTKIYDTAPEQTKDSDVAKWIESASYSLMNNPDPELEAELDKVIGYIAGAQDKDGYLNTYFTIKDQDKRWTNLHEAHELYVAGHMIECQHLPLFLTKLSANAIIRKNSSDSLQFSSQHCAQRSSKE